jgi:hypothetical protein
MKLALPFALFLLSVHVLFTPDLAAFHQADMQVGRSLSSLAGDNVYGPAASQSLRLRLTRSVRFFARMEHDLEFTNATSLGSAVVRLRGNDSSRLRLRVFQVEGVRQNVTAAMIAAGVPLPNLDVLNRADFSIQAVRKRDASPGSVRLSLTGILIAGSETSRDSVEAGIRVPRIP